MSGRLCPGYFLYSLDVDLDFKDNELICGVNALSNAKPNLQEDYRARLTSQQTTPTVKAIRALMMNDSQDLDVVAFQVPGNFCLLTKSSGSLSIL